MINIINSKNLNFEKNMDSKSIDNNENFLSKSEDIDSFVRSFKEEEKNRLEGNKFSKISSSFTAGIVSLGICFLGLGTILHKIRKNPLSAMNSLQKEKFITKNIRNGALTLLAAIGSYVGLNFLHNKNIDKISPDTINKFNNYNTETSAKIADNHFRSRMLYAKYNIINGEIELNKDFINDPIKRIYLDKIIKHELEHAKQFEMIASLDYGIEKLNYALMKNISSNIKDNVVAEGIIAVNDILQKNTSKDFDNITITIQGAEVNMKKYFKGMATLLQNPNCTYKDIPMIIDKSHYLKAIEKRGPLTEEEKEKAEEYYKAYLKYNCTTSDILNPFSQKYNKNILEKDAIIASKK